MHHSRSSSTARLIARCTLLASGDDTLKALVPVDAEAPLTAMLRADGNSSWFEFALRHGWTRRACLWLERAILPGIIAHFLARKRWIERAVTVALNNGCNQLVIIGAGLDTLALRLHRSWPSVTFWELDHPASQRAKAEAFKRLSPAKNLFLLALDLRKELPSEVLRRNTLFNQHGQTCFVAEGLLMYLPEGRVIQVLQDVAKYVNSDIVLTFMEPDADGQAAFRGGSPAIDKWLRWRSEPFAWAIARAKLAEFATPLGLQVLAIAGSDDLRAEFLTPIALASTALAEGECLGLLSSAQ